MTYGARRQLAKVPAPTIEPWKEDRERACRVAAEHMLWALKNGQSLADILLSIGHSVAPGMGEDDVLIALEREWLMVCRPYRKARPHGTRLGKAA
jgi:hypothetical protein